jgi:hypothetical protein
MARRRREVDVACLSDADLLARALDRDDLDEYERDAFADMLDRLRRRAEEYGDDAYGLTEGQRGWVERAVKRPRRERMSGSDFEEVVRATIGRELRLRR